LRLQSYEQEIAALADKLRVRSAHLGQEEAQLCAFLESAAAKFERWCEPGYEEKVVEAEGDGGGVVTLPHTVEVVEMKEMGQLGGMEPLNDASFYATQERDELQEEEEEEETRGDRMPRLEQVQAMSESQLKALAVKLDKVRASASERSERERAKRAQRRCSSIAPPQPSATLLWRHPNRARHSFAVLAGNRLDQRAQRRRSSVAPPQPSATLLRCARWNQARKEVARL
jgi:hypothetical protein